MGTWSVLSSESIKSTCAPRAVLSSKNKYSQIYPRSFKDSNGDGIGDIQGIIDNLDHLKDLGVTGAWLSPIFKSPMKGEKSKLKRRLFLNKTFNSDGGYDIQDFYNVNEMFGTNEDLEKLFDEAKKLELKIILDFVS